MVVMGHVRVIAGTLTGRYRRVISINLSKSAKTKRNEKLMRNRSAVFSCIYTQNIALSCQFVCTSASFHQTHVPWALFSVNFTIFNAFSYVCHVKMRGFA